MLLTGQSKAVEGLFKLFGIKMHECRKMVVTIEVDCLVTVDAEYYADVQTDDNGELIIPTELKQYRLSAEEIEDVAEVNEPTPESRG